MRNNAWSTIPVRSQNLNNTSDDEDSFGCFLGSSGRSPPLKNDPRKTGKIQKK
eukprot:UN14729